MRITTSRFQDLGSGELARWHALQDAHPLFDNAFLSPEFSRLVDRYRGPVHVAIFEDSSGIVGFLPFERSSYGVGRAVGLGLSDAQGVVMDSACSSVPWRRVVEAAGLSMLEFDHLLGAQTTPEVHTHQFSCPVVVLREGYDAYDADRHRVHRERFKGFDKKRRKLEREQGPAVFTYHQADLSALAPMAAWKSAHYRRTSLHDLFSEPWYVEMVHEAAATRAPHLTGVLSTLEVGGRLAAAQLSLQSKRSLAGWITTYDPALSQYSPGIELLRRILQQSASAGFDRYELGRGDEAFKQHFKNSDTPICTAWIAPPSLRALARRSRRAPREQVEWILHTHPRLRPVATSIAERLRRFRTRC